MDNLFVFQVDSLQMKYKNMVGDLLSPSLNKDPYCQQRSVQPRLWFFQWSCMDVRVGL